MYTTQRSLLTVLLLFLFTMGYAQKMTKIKGTVIDADTKEPLIVANVGFVGTSVGTTTDFDGNYVLESQYATDKLFVSYLGYDSDTFDIEIGKTTTLDVQLVSTSLVLKEVVVSVKKARYKKKGNPAVELIRKVIKNKKTNSIESQSFYQYDQYEKIELDLNNISDKFRKRRVFKKFQFIFDYVDTSELNGKPYLPFFLQETSSTVYYRKDPKTKREYRNGIQRSSVDGYFDESSITAVIDRLYEDIDINKNNIPFATQQFVSPLSIIAPDFYKFYILDTINYEGMEVIDLTFLPRNKQDFGFKGNLYITNDSTYRVVKVEMGILPDINLNFIQDVKIEQEFGMVENQWIRTKDRMLIDYSLTKKGLGMFGSRTVNYSNFTFNQPAIGKYGGTENVIIADDAYERADDYWNTVRPEKLNKQEEGVYVMVDTLQRVPAFRRTLKILTLLFSGYTDVGALDVGPINAFFSFNQIEGFRLRLGGRTNLKFNNKVQLEAYGAYGFNDQRFKHYASAMYSFNENFEDHPRHYFKVSHMRETKFPGQVLEYITEDNFILSFKRGNQNRMMFFTSARLEYFHELKNNFSYQVIAENRNHEPLGELFFNYFDGQDNVNLSDIRTTELKVNLQYSPNAQYFNTKNFRYNLVNKFPVFKLNYTLGIDGLGGDYNYNQLKLNIFKRFNLSILGYTITELEGGKTWGNNIPYILLFMPRANQTFSYQNNAYNMMNYLEFISDEYVSLNVRHYFNGLFLNRIPLLRKLKLREVVSFKGLYGRLTDANNPSVDASLVQFATDEDGRSITYTLEDKPYMEVSAGISNIFKVIRVDVVKRLTYNDLPNTPQLWGIDGLGLRVRGVVKF